MKAVLISIQPKWCELIASGNKTIEVRKTKPKIQTPFKCYIYCTLAGSNEFFKEKLNGDVAEWNRGKWADKKGKVIGEFVCDRIRCEKELEDWIVNVGLEITSCLSVGELLRYADGYALYSWHISDLVIYDKPKELSEFYRYCGDNPNCEGCEAHYYSNTESGKEDYCCSDIYGCKPLTRPPQSWCYVEERREQ